jgi:hypothetical protein
MLHERLDAKIARKVKYLAELKAMKQMLRQTGALDRAGQQPTKNRRSGEHRRRIMIDGGQRRRRHGLRRHHPSI